MKELWLPVVGHEKNHLVSNTGKVWNCRKNKEQKQRLIDKRYAAVTLCLQGICKTRKVHHLVAEAFIGPRPDGLWCLHKDDNRANNTAENLYWGTPKQNAADCNHNGNRRNRTGSSNTQAKLTEKEVREIRALISTHSHAAKVYGVSVSQVSAIRNRTKWAHLT